MMRYILPLLIALGLCLLGIQTVFARDIPRRVYDAYGKDISLYELETQKKPTKKLSNMAFAEIARYGLPIVKVSNDKKRYFVSIDGMGWWVKTFQTRTDESREIRPCISAASNPRNSSTRGAGECSK